MKTTVRILHIFMFFLILSPVSGQHIKDELVRINQKYKDSENLHMEVSLKAHESATAASEEEAQRGIIVKGKNYLYNKMGEVETMIQDTLRLVVDHSKKMMVLIPQSTNADSLAVPSAQIENALKICSKVEAIKKTGVKGYELWMNKEGTEKISFTYNPETYLLDRVEFLYKTLTIGGEQKENVRLQMEYSYPKNKKMDRITLDHFVLAVNGKFENTPAFESYQLIDYTLLSGKNSKR